MNREREEKCAREERGNFLCDRCHKRPGVEFILGQLLCLDCKDRILDAEEWA